MFCPECDLELETPWPNCPECGAEIDHEPAEPDLMAPDQAERSELMERVLRDAGRL